MIEDLEGLTLYAGLPGVPKDRLSVHIDGETLFIEGEMGLGVLKVRIQKAEHAKPRKIEISG